MNKVFRLVSNLFKNKFFLFLAILVLISYGQILGMYVWQDDNALFFKLAHIEEKAGYFGPGPFGIGAYKYIQTPYIPIYKIFGFNTVPYFVFTLTLYFVTTVIVYKIFSQILGSTGGRIVGFLYACGYIASDGYIRLFNSSITSFGIIIVSLLFLSLYKYLNTRKIRWYLLAVLSFFTAIEFAISRMHYLISVVFLFEIIFLMFEKPLKSIFFSFIRLSPFLYLFYHHFVLNGDQRSGQVKVLLTDLSGGKIYETYSFIASITSVLLPDWISGFLLKLQNLFLRVTAINFPFSTSLVWIISMVVALYILRGKKLFQIITGVAISSWTFFENHIYANPVLNLSSEQHLIIYLGGILLIFLAIGALQLKNSRKLYFFLSGWMLLNIAVYSAYNPSVHYTSINRYLAHSFLMVTALLAYVYLSIRNSRAKAVTLCLIIIWGMGNLTGSVFYQHKIIETRSNPPRQFYASLKSFVPSVSKGDVFYLDVADSAKGFYQEAFSVASMPETTALAWRYGVDRYDISLLTNFTDLKDHISIKNTQPNQIHSFWYSKNGLVDTSQDLRSLLFQERLPTEVSFDSLSGDVALFKNPPVSVMPIELTFWFRATLKKPEPKDFPIGDIRTATTISKDPRLHVLVFDYQNFVNQISQKAKYQVSSQWRERIIENLFDKNRETFWQADRVLWQKRNEHFQIDLGENMMVDRFVWVNGLSHNTPTRYKVESSLDGETWTELKSVDNLLRIDSKNPQVISFPKISARFFRMTIKDTLSGDSPAISEAWIVPIHFSNLDILETEQFLREPFKYVATADDFNQIIALLEGMGEAQIFWKNNNSDKFQTKENIKIKIPYNGISTTATFIIPAGGTRLEKFRLSNFTIPGNVTVQKILVKYPAIKELP